MNTKRLLAVLNRRRQGWILDREDYSHETKSAISALIADGRIERFFKKTTWVRVPAGADLYMERRGDAVVARMLRMVKP